MCKAGLKGGCGSNTTFNCKYCSAPLCTNCKRSQNSGKSFNDVGTSMNNCPDCKKNFK